MGVGGVREKILKLSEIQFIGGGRGVSLVRVMVGLNLETVLENFRDSKKNKTKKKKTWQSFFQ